jgi:LysM domain
MKYSKELLTAVVVAGFLAGGCAGHKRIEGMDVPTQPEGDVVVAPPPAQPLPETAPPPPAPVEQPTPVPAPPTPVPTPVQAAKPSIDTYIVVKGDTLWGISGMKIAYHDNFQWPLLFKANRDQIKDPDLIYPKQEFLLRRDWTKEDIDKARKDASETPVYVPHTKPREVLPVDYF